MTVKSLSAKKEKKEKKGSKKRGQVLCFAYRSEGEQNQRPFRLRYFGHYDLLINVVQIYSVFY